MFGFINTIASYGLRQMISEAIHDSPWYKNHQGEIEERWEDDSFDGLYRYTVKLGEERLIEFSGSTFPDSSNYKMETTHFYQIWIYEIGWFKKDLLHDDDISFKGEHGNKLEKWLSKSFSKL